MMTLGADSSQTIQVQSSPPLEMIHYLVVQVVNYRLPAMIIAFQLSSHMWKSVKLKDTDR